MFLTMLQTRNPNLVTALFNLHQRGLIMPDTTVLDLETIQHNARHIAKHARDHHLQPFFITKQFGFNPLVAQSILNAGFSGVVCVDFREAQMCMHHGLPIANVGHLVQMPRAIMASVIEYGVEFCTIYSIEKAQQLNDIAARLGKKQKILIKVIAENGTVYPGQEAGFSLAQLASLVQSLKAMPNLIVAGLTAFPCWLYSVALQKIAPTANVALLHQAREMLKMWQIEITDLNMPSANAYSSIPEIARAGGTHIEAGHSLTGSTPMHAYHEEAVEIPAMAYVSEISHHYNGASFFYGGGGYRRYPIAHALIGTSVTKSLEAKVTEFDATSIDYHFRTPDHFEIGATVIASFRTQVFVTRSEVVVLDKVQSDPENPKILGRFSALGDLRAG